jgi:DhnA family fructose-bisphosphate aldolase class Ia
MRTFSSSEYFSDGLLARLTGLRVDRPELAFEAAKARVRRSDLTRDGRLNLLAADHPARNVTKVGENTLGMGNRRDYLARIIRVLSSDSVDGVMATMDILEDLLFVDGLLRESGRPSLLDHRLLIASLNRGGLAGSVWELDDPMTGANAITCDMWGLDGAKLLLRVDNSEASSLRTIVACSQAISETNAFQLPMFLEPLPVSKTDRGYVVSKRPEDLARLVGVASALGDSSRYLWLKLPFCENFELVAQSTTLPILLLGGESAGDPKPFLSELAQAMSAAGNVRGALVGRNALYPGAADPIALGDAAGGIVHSGWSVQQAHDSITTNPCGELDLLAGLCDRGTR